MSAPVTGVRLCGIFASAYAHFRDETKESILCGTLLEQEGVVLEQVEGFIL